MKLFLLIKAGCKRHSLQNKRYRFFAICRASGKASTKPEDSTERGSLRDGLGAKNNYPVLQPSKRQTARTLLSKPGRATAVPTCRSKWLGATSRYGSSTTWFQTARSCRAVYMMYLKATVSFYIILIYRNRN